MFLNIDVVLPPSETCEKWNFELWKNWMYSRQISKRSKNPNRFSKLPGAYKHKEENQPSGLFEQ